MNLLNITVLHKVWGEGLIIQHENEYLLVQFKVKPAGKDTDVVKFSYPTAFNGFLKVLDNDLLQETILNEIEENKKAELAKKQAIHCESIAHKVAIERKKPKKTYKRENIVFKCNFCNGGTSETQIGFAGVCSKEIIDYNINVAKRSWCGFKNSKCRQFVDGEISYEQILNDFQNGEMICYESTMLLNWKASAGIDNSGENAGRKRKLNKIQNNSLCVLSTVDPRSDEESRYVFGVFLVDESYEGDDQEEGYVTTSSKYKIKLTPEEARKVLLWNYHKNSKDESRAVWASGLYRYINDTVSAQILRDIAEIKKHSVDAELAKEFFEYYCEVNKINIDDLPPNNGALMLKTD